MTSHPTRRRFLGWSASLGATPLLGSVGLGLSACGGQDNTAADDIPVLQTPQQVHLRVEARKVEWVPGKTPSQANAWVYVPAGSSAPDAVLPNHLGPTFEVRRHQPCSVTWTNAIGANSPGALLMAEPPIHAPINDEFCGQVRLQSSVALVTHLHGARVQGGSDGWPLAPLGFAGNPYGFASSRNYFYPNDQRAALLWYHDHALDRTGAHVHAGLAGLYIIRDTTDDAVGALLGGPAQEQVCVIQDRVLKPDQLAIDYAAGMPADAADEDGNRPEFLGTTLFVNGHPGGERSVERRAQRLRVLNGCNARTVALALCDLDALAAGRGRIWHTDRLRLIGADGGFISRSLPLAATDALTVAPGQRRDLMLDLSGLPATVQRLRLVNLCLQPLLNSPKGAAEPIFTTHEDSLLLPRDASAHPDDRALYEAIRQQPLAKLQDLTLAASTDTPPPSPAALDKLLADSASDSDFVWSGQQLQARPDLPFGPNRLVLLMSNTLGFGPEETGSGLSGWGDVQLFEMDSSGASNDWQLPFAVDLKTSVNPPAAGAIDAQQGYTLARRSFFAELRNPDITLAKAYPALHEPVVRARAGTYERWYVANIGNAQPLNKAAGDPDMHPFHIHLVNFVVTRRWVLDDADEGRFQVAEPEPLDGIARQDTVLIPSGQLVELLVYYPPGYRGDYAFHCHLLEHEDMCMMSHFNVT